MIHLFTLAALLGVGSAYSPRTGAPVLTAAGAPKRVERTLVWAIGSPWGRPAPADGQGIDQPLFSGLPARCVAEESGAAQCVGGSGAVHFHVRRPDTAVPAHEYRNMMVLQKWNAAHTYAFNYQLVPNGVYDVRFQTVNHYEQDAKDVQSLVWQNHAGDGSVLTGLGVINPDGKGNQWFFNYANPAGESDAFHWHGAMTPGATDTWEIQFRNSSDASGWIDLYRNGARQLHFKGPVVKTTRYDLMSFGIYYYNWQIKRSTVLSQDLTFNYFELATIPGPVPPLPARGPGRRGG